MQIRLTWSDPITGERRQRVLNTPIAIGRDSAALPQTHEGQSVSPLVIEDEALDRFHALIEDRNGTPLITVHAPGQTVSINDLPLPTSTLFDGDLIQLGAIAVQLSLPAPGTSFPVSPPSSSPLSPPSPSPSAAADLPEIAAARSFSGSGDDNWQDDQAIGPEGCDRQVGFLFKRRCGRTTRAGCPFCKGGRVQDNDPYFYEDYDYYPGYGSYHRGGWGYPYYSNRDLYYYDRERGMMDFTEADAAAFESEGDQDYEMDMGAS